MEIKFRAWHKIEQKYYECHEIDFWWRSLTQYESGKNFEFKFYDVILEQYTGVKDCDGKEIYVGDILSDPFEQDYVVKFNNDFASFFLYPIGKEEKFMAFYKNIRMTVVGNIHENKDLLNNV